MNVRTVLFLLATLINSYCFAQTKKDNYWKLELITGANTEFSHFKSSTDEKSFGTRPKVVPLIGLKTIYLFTDKLGGYARLQINFYDEKNSEYYNSGLIGEVAEAFIDKLFWPISKSYPLFDIGLLYRFEKENWAVYPEIGFGQMVFLADRESSRTKNKEGVKTEIQYRQRSSPFFLNLGISANYNISKNNYILFNASFSQPVKKSKAELIHITDGIETERLTSINSTFGRSLNLSAGIGVTINRK